MLIAHLADLHLGYRAYHRLAPGGVNQRERDVSEALGRAIEQVIEMRPDLVLVAGDVFHTVRPSNSAIMDGFRLFLRLRAGLPGVPVVMIAGQPRLSPLRSMRAASCDCLRRSRTSTWWTTWRAPCA